jgi:hypothetical protein
LSLPLNLCKSEIQVLSYIMHHAVQDALDIHLDLSSKRKAAQPHPVLDISKHGLGDRYPLVIDIPPSLRVNLLSHLFDQIARSGPPQGHPDNDLGSLSL